MSVTSQQPSATAAQPIVELKRITKRYAALVANDAVDLSVYPGEVHCLLGENGAGKSTLISILSGAIKPDSGSIAIDGREVVIDSPRQALDHGIGTVYQHSKLVPSLTVIENLVLGQGRGVRLELSQARSRFAALAASLGVEVDPHAGAGTLALGQQQQVEIMKALWHEKRVLILDEPTAMLTASGVLELQKVLLRLKQQGLAILFITHKLYEAFAITDRLSILRRGRLISTIDPETVRSSGHDALRQRILGEMFGAEDPEVAAVAELQADPIEHERRARVATDVLLELVDVYVGGDSRSAGIHHVSLDLRIGEIVGIAGVDGNGQSEVAEAIAGQRRVQSGDIRLAGVSIKTLSVSARERLGLRYVTDDRLGEGTVSSLSVALNLVLKRIGQPPFWRRGRIRPDAIDAAAEELVTRFDVRTTSVSTPIAQLSGGNIQKVLLARELSFQPKVVIYNKPTHGLDVKTTAAVREQIRIQAEAGVTALVISPDLEELLDLCDRIAVLYGGRIQGVVENKPGAATDIGALMIGAQEHGAT